MTSDDDEQSHLSNLSKSNSELSEQSDVGDSKLSHSSNLSKSSSESSEQSASGDIKFDIILDDNRKGILKIKEKDDIYQKLIDFCKNNNCTEKEKDFIMKKIYLKLNELINNLEIKNRLKALEKKENKKENENENNAENKSENENDNKTENITEKKIENIIENKNEINSDNTSININNINRNRNKRNSKLKPNKSFDDNINNNNNFNYRKKKLKPNKSFDDKFNNFKKKKFCQNYGDYIGHLLYEKGINHKLKVQKKLKEKYNDNPNMPSDYPTFKPKISNRSKEITSNRNKKIKIEDRLMALGKEREKKILKKVAEKNFNENEKNNYNFHPKITKNKGVLTRNKNEDIFTKLYKEADIHKNKIQKTNDNFYKKKYPFKPKISKKSQKMNDSEYEQIMKRLYENTQKKQNEILMEHMPMPKKKGKNFNNINIDKKNNNVIIDINNKKSNNNYIIQINNDDNDNDDIDNNSNMNNNLEDINKKKDWVNYNNNIINKIKEVKFKEIFDLLDKNKKKYISYTNISYNNIPNKIMIALTPVIEEVNRNKNKKIYFEEFKSLVDESLTEYMLNE